MSQVLENSSIINRFDALFSLLKEVLLELRKILNFQQISHYDYSLLECGIVLSSSTNVFKKCATPVFKTQKQSVTGTM